MIEKIPDQIPVQTGEWGGTTFDIIPKETFGMACRKINELCDTINTIQKEREAERFEIQEWIGIIEAVRKSVNKLETMAENTTDSKMENVAENSQSAKIAQDETLKCPFCQQELETGNYYVHCHNPHCNPTVEMEGTEEMWLALIRTRKALEIAWAGLEKIGSGDIIEHSVVGHEDDNKIFIANKTLDESKTALEQKE